MLNGVLVKETMQFSQLNSKTLTYVIALELEEEGQEQGQCAGGSELRPRLCWFISFNTAPGQVS